MDITPLIWPAVEREELARVLDEVGHDVRLAAVFELGREDMARLFDAAADNELLTLDQLVPPETPPLQEVIHQVKGSVAPFERFQKRFCRPRADAQSELWGYDERPLRVLTGSIYFVANRGPKGVVLDHGRRPEGPLPEGWPPLRSDVARRSRFVAHTSEDLRRVSNLVSIGRTRRGERPMDAWFMLVRAIGRPTSGRPVPDL